MREIIFDIKDISDSREVMSKKAPPPISWFLYIIITVIIIAIAFASIGEIEEYVRMTGEVRPQQPVSSIITSTGGKLTAVNIEEGQHVNKGDILFELDKDSVLQQKNITKKKYDEIKLDLDKLNKLNKSIELGQNLFKKNDSDYYYRYENYKVTLDNSIFEINKSNKDNKQAKSTSEYSLGVINESLSKAQIELNAYSNLISFIKKDDLYEDESSNTLVYNLYKDYESKYSKANIVYKKSVDDYYEIKKKYDEQEKNSVSSKSLSSITTKPTSSSNISSSNVTQSNSISTVANGTSDIIKKDAVENAKYLMRVSQADYEGIKSSFIVQLDTTINQLSKQIYSLKNDKDKLALSIIHLDDTTMDTQETTLSSEQLTRIKMKTDMIVSINNSIKSLQTDTNVLDEKLVQIEDTIKNSGIVANTSGVITFLQEVNNGDILQAGGQLLKIMPNENNLKVVLFVPESQVAKIAVGDKVQYIVNSMPINEYGKITGSITSISADSFSNETSGEKFYKAEAVLDKSLIKNAKGEIREIKAGMITDARVISSSKKIIVWLLQKINLMD